MKNHDFLFLPRLDNNREKNPKKDMFLSSKTNVVRIHYLHAKRRERNDAIHKQQIEIITVNI